jgi:hypothetical protein
MTYLCLWNSGWHSGSPTIPLHTTLLSIVPRVTVAADVIWIDLHGLPVSETTERVLRVLRANGADATKIGVAGTPVAAEVAARYAAQVVTYVLAGEDRLFLAPLPVGVLHPNPALANLLDGAGIERCGDLARLTHEAVEVRFGADGARLWRLARADDPRRIFKPIPRGLPESSLEWTDYTLRRAERLVFVINALCGNVCEALSASGAGAVTMTLRFSLANRTTYEQPLRVARATARHVAWMRIIRLELERLVLPDAVVGIALRVDATAGLGGKQGDIFDRGFGTLQAVEESIGALLDDQGAVVVEPDSSSHPLIDRRSSWTAIPAARAADSHERGGSATITSLAITLQIFPQPVRVTVSTITRRANEVPHSYRDHCGTHRIVDASGPDRVSGDQWNAPYAREYFRCVDTDGTLIWLYHELRTGAWYMHGWWD